MMGLVSSYKSFFLKFFAVDPGYLFPQRIFIEDFTFPLVSVPVQFILFFCGVS